MTGNRPSSRSHGESSDVSLILIFLALLLFMGVVVSMAYPPARQAGLNLILDVESPLLLHEPEVRVNQLPHV